MVAPLPKSEPGQVLAQRYRLESQLGQGGVGTVFLATDLQLSRQVAVKSLLPEMVSVEGGLERFEREAKLAQRLHHPNTIRVLDFGRDPRGLPFIVFELLKGQSLEQAFAHGPMSAGRVRDIAEQVLKSLMEAHHGGVVHRDIKPSNIFLCDESQGGIVKVLDFGVASIRDASGTNATSTGQVLGTPRYMAPEQVVSTSVTPATDLYALGLVMAEALAGAPVFGGDSAVRVCMEQMSEQPVPLPEAVRASPLGAVIVRATQKSASARFGSAEEMLAALRTTSGSTAVSPGAVVVSPPQGPSVPPGSYAATPQAHAMSFAPTAHATPQLPAPPPAESAPAKRNKLLWLIPAGLLGAAALLGGLAVGLAGSRDADSGDDEAPVKARKVSSVLSLSDDEEEFMQESAIAVRGPMALGQCLRDEDWKTSGDEWEIDTETRAVSAHVTVRRKKKKATIFILQFPRPKTAVRTAETLREDGEAENVDQILNWVFYSTGSNSLGKAAIGDLLDCRR